MKKRIVVYDDLVDIDKIIRIYHKIMINTKHRDKIFDYNMFYMSNLINIYNILLNKNYYHGLYNLFFIKEPKIRLIMSEKLNDKIVNHLISDYVLIPLIEPHLIDMNVATRKDKGSKMARYYMKKYLNEIKNKYSSFSLLKCDISKYFYNIDHSILLSKLKKIINDEDLYDLVKNIINSTDDGYANMLIRDMNCNTIPFYENGKGLPIGNQSSQILAIYYLNDMDHFIKEELHIKYYFRYMDDFILIYNNRDYLKYCYKEIDNYLNKIDLKLNKKSNIYNINNGITFLGYKYYLKNNRLIVLISSKNKRKIRTKIINGKSSINNYNGYLKWCNSHNFIRRVDLQKMSK